MARAAAAPQAGVGGVKYGRKLRKCWPRRGGVSHHPGVQIDLAALPDDPAMLQQMLRDVVAAAPAALAAGAVQEREPRTTSCAC